LLITPGAYLLKVVLLGPFPRLVTVEFLVFPKIFRGATTFSATQTLETFMSKTIAALLLSAALVLPVSANAAGLSEAPIAACAKPLVQTAVATVQASPKLSTLFSALKSLISGVKSAKASLAEFGTCTPPAAPPPGQPGEGGQIPEAP
jgi:hypothetical protein